MLIAEDAGKPVGWAFAHDHNAELSDEPRRHGYIAELYVVPQARGKGLGRALIQGREDRLGFGTRPQAVHGGRAGEKSRRYSRL